jgi:hypothetical protein
MKRIAHLFAACLLLALPAAAHTPQPPPHQLYSEGDLKLESGEAIRDFSISYVTHGTLNAKKSNAMGKNIASVKMMTISPGTVTGHASAGGAIPADVEFLNREAGAFLDAVTEGGKRLN